MAEHQYDDEDVLCERAVVAVTAVNSLTLKSENAA